MMAVILLAQSAKPTVEFETGGMIVMGLSVLLVSGLTLFCVTRLLRDKSPEEHHHVPLDIDTRDFDL
jgi:hypothetical protein